MAGYWEEEARKEREKREQALRDQWSMVQGGGYQVTPDIIRRQGDINLGRMMGEQEFEKDPEMQRLKALREQYARGYEGEIGGAIRQQARGEIAGAQQAQQRKLAGALGRGGVGGARAASIQAASGREGAKAVAEAERGMALDSYRESKEGSADLQDFVFRSKLGKMGTAFGFAGLGSADYAARQAAEANKDKGGGFLSWLFG